jgi:hypothetical protein
MSPLTLLSQYDMRTVVNSGADAATLLDPGTAVEQLNAFAEAPPRVTA